MPDTITPQNQIEEDIEFIRTTDRVLGDPPGTQGVLSGPINVIIQKIANYLLYLKDRLDNLTITVPNATTSNKGIAELANQTEGRSGSDSTRIMTSQRVQDYIRNASNARATTTHYGVAIKATQTQAVSLTDTSAYLTAALVEAILRHSNAQASETRRGTVEFANETEAQDENNNTKALTAASLYRTARNEISSDGKWAYYDVQGDLTTRALTPSTILTEIQFYFGPILLDEEIEYEHPSTVTFTASGSMRINQFRGQTKTGWLNFTSLPVSNFAAQYNWTISDNSGLVSSSITSTTNTLINFQFTIANSTTTRTQVTLTITGTLKD